jgi:3-hydroxybutyryl-CoA dehydratase
MAGIKEKKYSDIQVGDQGTYSKTIRDEDVRRFAEITGDFNPVHVDEEFARNSLFGGRIAHGFLTGALISTVFGTILPGPNTIYLSQELNFKAPVKIGDTITAVCEVLEKKDAKKILKFKTQVKNQAGKVVLDGQATVMKYEK